MSLKLPTVAWTTFMRCVLQDLLFLVVKTLIVIGQSFSKVF